MKVNLFESYNTSKEEQRRRHLLTLGISIIISMALWYLVSIRVYADLTPAERMKEFLEDLWQTVLETTVLFELAVLYSKAIIKVMWRSEHTFWRLVLQCLILFVLNISSAGLMGWLYSMFYPDMLVNGDIYYIMFGDGATVYFATSIFFMSYLFNRHRDETENALRAEKEAERERAATLDAKLEKLALQTDNHFVFNSFSTLDSLIGTDPGKASEYLHGLSAMYRYLITHADTHIVSLRDEMAFTREYVRLVLFRYSGIEIQIAPELDRIDGFIIPVSIQQLVENAIKHNRHGKDDLLTIDVSYSDGFVKVSNNILAHTGTGCSTGQGLRGIRSRLGIVTDREMLLKDDGKEFAVGIPVLSMEDLKDEDIDH